MRLGLLIALFFLASCNSEMATLSPIRYTKVRIVTANEGTFNRMMIYVKKSDGSHAFARLFNSIPVIEDEVPIGQYNFYGLSYNGMISERCSKASAFLGGNSNQVTLTFSEVACADSDFVGSDPDLNLATPPAVTFANTELEFCDSLENITSGSDRCSDYLLEPSRKHKRGHAMSAMITLMTYEKFRGQYITGPGLSWGCQNVTSSSYLRGLAFSGVSNFAPAGDGSTTPFLIRFEFYPNSTTCSGETPYIVDLENGLEVNNSKAKHMITSAGPPSTRKIYFKLGSDEICQGDNLTSEFAGGGTNFLEPKLICNEAQLYNIFPSTNVAADYVTRANYSYKLMRDIDLSDNQVTGSGFNPPWASCVSPGSNFMPIGYTWDGSACSTTLSSGIHFEGNDKTINGMTIIRPGSFVGMYRRLDHAGGQASVVQNLNISNSYFSGLANVGALSALSQRTSFTNINLTGTTVVSTSSSFTGTIAGETLGAIIDNVHGENVRVIGEEYVGGLVGQTSLADNGSTTNISNSSIRGEISGAVYVGGLVGLMGNSSTGVMSLIRRSSFIGNVTANNTLGGLVGEGISLRIINSYARTAFRAEAPSAVYLGGLVGSMRSREASGPSGIYNSYLTGSLSHLCTALPAANCFMGSVLGIRDASFTSFDFNTVVYPVSDHINTTLYTYGVSQPDLSFFTSTPNWVTPLNVSMMGSFPSSVWLFSNGAYPSLVGEPNP